MRKNCECVLTSNLPKTTVLNRRIYRIYHDSIGYGYYKYQLKIIGGYCTASSIRFRRDR